MKFHIGGKWIDVNNSNGTIAVVSSEDCMTLILKRIIHQTSINPLITVFSLAMAIKADKHSVSKTLS